MILTTLLVLNSDTILKNQKKWKKSLQLKINECIYYNY